MADLSPIARGSDHSIATPPSTREPIPGAASLRSPVARPSRAAPAPGRSGSARPNGSARPVTVEEWLRVPEESRAELIHGHLVYHAFPGVKHGNTQARMSRLLSPYDRRRKLVTGGGGGGPSELGGWWLSQEVDLLLGGVGCRPDIVGWRRDKHSRVPQIDVRGVITVTPDFLCEVLSDSTARYDQGDKQEAYFRAGVPHYWLVDPMRQTLTILEWTERGYLIVRVAGPGDSVKAAPFDGVDILVDDLFLDEEGELPAGEPASAIAAPTEPAAPHARGKRADKPPSSPPPAPKKKAPHRTR